LSAANTFSGEDIALATLLLPFATGALAWPDARVLFVNARDGWPLHAVPRQRIVCVQDFKPHADALQRGGLTVATCVDDETFPLVLFLPPRQRIEARAELARAVQCASIGGIVAASLANNEGARSGEADMQRLLGPLQSISKNHCRVFWASVHDESMRRGRSPTADSSAAQACLRGIASMPRRNFSLRDYPMTCPGAARISALVSVTCPPKCLRVARG